MINNDDLKRIKLIIWDLDETFWIGTLAESEDVIIPPHHVDLVKKLAGRGIISSICSKNSEKAVSVVLHKHEVDNFFVFKSINWNAKGPRIKEIIENMNLKDKNVLFIDDNPSNLGEARAFCPNIMCSGPDIIIRLIAEVNNIGKDDTELSRLKEYHNLETKFEASKHYKSADKFLKQSKIKVSLLNDCINNIERIHELILRTNQLNYTKKRIDKICLLDLLNNPEFFNSYITCKDKYGDYGIVGFVSLNLKSNHLEHFLFSCRTLGMGIESFIYNLLNLPKIEVVQPVTKQLLVGDFGYIKLVDAQINKVEKKNSTSIFMRGPCDLEALAFYLDNDNIVSEFSYVGKHGVPLYQIGHSQVILDSYNYVPINCPFVENNMYKTQLFTHKYDVVILSSLTEAQFGLYEDENGRRFVYGECFRSAYSQNEITDFQQGFYDLSQKDFLVLKNYKFLGRITVDDSIENYDKIINLLPSTTLVFILLGPTTPITNEQNVSIKQLKGELFYQELNNKLYLLAQKHNNLYLVNPRVFKYKKTFFKDFSSSTHYSRKTYYYMAKDIERLSRKAVKPTYKKEIGAFVSRIKIILKSKFF